MFPQIVLLYVSFFICSKINFAQNNTYSSSIDSLNKYREAIFNVSSNNNVIELNSIYVNILKRLLEKKESLSIPFDNLNKISVLSTSDNSLRIFNWNVQLNDNEQKYFGFIQFINKKKYTLIELNDATEASQTNEFKQLDHKKWIGALYYDIVSVKHRKQKHYVLLGWDGNNKISTKKIIEVLTIQGTNVRFGAEVFKMNSKPKRRFIFEYSKEATMSLKYHPEKKQIVYDHLSPIKESLIGSYHYYGPDMTYDALELKKGKWYLVENILINGNSKEPLNPKISTKERKIYNPEE